MRKLHVLLMVAAITFWSGARAEATFHFWGITEMYSNADGTVQFIELFSASSSQQFTNGQVIRAIQGASTNDFTFPSDTPSPTNGKNLLIATAAFAALPGAVAPDFTLADGFLFAPDGTVQFLGTTQGLITYATLPTDGILSLAADGVTTAINSPTNFAGDAGSVNPSGPVPTVSEWGMVVMVGLLLSVGTLLIRRRSAVSIG